MTRHRKPYEFAEDPDPFVAIGIDAEWVFESAGKNLILSYQFALCKRRQRSDDEADHVSEEREAHIASSTD